MRRILQTEVLTTAVFACYTYFIFIAVLCEVLFLYVVLFYPVFVVSVQFLLGSILLSRSMEHITATCFVATVAACHVVAVMSFTNLFGMDYNYKFFFNNYFLTSR